MLDAGRVDLLSALLAAQIFDKRALVLRDVVASCEPDFDCESC